MIARPRVSGDLLHQPPHGVPMRLVKIPAVRLTRVLKARQTLK
jgi:hypothetical protein